MSEKKPAPRREVKVAVAYPPFVSLLPPEVGQRKAAVKARGRAIFVALIALAVAVLVGVGANLYSLQRTATLEEARTRTLSLTTQQGEYSEVRTANQLVQSTQAARIFALSTEVSVESLINGMQSKLSDGMAITEYRFTTANPLQSFGQSLSPLDPEAMAGFTLQVQAGSVAAIDDWVRNLPSVKGIVHVTLENVKTDENGVFTGAVTVLISDDALVHRFDGFVAEEEPAAVEQAPPAIDPPVETDSTEPAPDANDEESD